MHIYILISYICLKLYIYIQIFFYRVFSLNILWIKSTSDFIFLINIKISCTDKFFPSNIKVQIFFRTVTDTYIYMYIHNIYIWDIYIFIYIYYNIKVQIIFRTAHIYIHILYIPTPPLSLNRDAITTKNSWLITTKNASPHLRGWQFSDANVYAASMFKSQLFMQLLDKFSLHVILVHRKFGQKLITLEDFNELHNATTRTFFIARDKDYCV